MYFLSVLYLCGLEVEDSFNLLSLPVHLIIHDMQADIMEGSRYIDFTEYELISLRVKAGVLRKPLPLKYLVVEPNSFL